MSEGRMINGQPAGQPRVHTTNHLSCSSMPERDRGESDQIWIIIMRVKISLDEILPIASRIRSTACCCPSQSKILQGCHFSLHVFLLFFFIWIFFSQLVCACVCSFLSCQWNILAMRTHYIQVRFDSLKIWRKRKECRAWMYRRGEVDVCIFSFTWYILLPAF